MIPFVCILQKTKPGRWNTDQPWLEAGDGGRNDHKWQRELFEVMKMLFILTVYVLVKFYSTVQLNG